MMSYKTTGNSARLALVVVPVLFLSGCAPLDWVKGKLGTDKPSTSNTTESLNDGSKVLATLDGKAIVTETSFNQAFDRILDENPQLKQMLPMIPNIKGQFLKGMVSQEVVNKYVADNGLDASTEYKQEFEQAVRSIRSALNTKYFTQKFPVNVSDSDVQKFYDEHKQDIPELLISGGGVKAAGISAKTEAEAKQIAAAAQGKNLEQYATTVGKKANFRDFGSVTDKSTGIDTGLKVKIMALKKFPTVEVLKATDGTFWVVSAAGAQEAQYQPFEKIKNELKGYLENKNRGDKITSEIERLSKEYKLVIIEDEANKADADKEAGPRVAQADEQEDAPSAARVA